MKQLFERKLLSNSRVIKAGKFFITVNNGKKNLILPRFFWLYITDNLMSPEDAMWLGALY